MWVFIVWVGLAILVGYAASTHRNRIGAGWFFLALIISPLLAGIILAVLRPIPKMEVKINYMAPMTGPNSITATIPPPDKNPVTVILIAVIAAVVIPVLIVLGLIVPVIH
jgi:hypothetical protein